MAEPQLYARLELRIKEFEKQLAKATGTADRSMSKMERRSQVMSRSIEQNLSRVGTAMKAFVGGLVAGGLSQFINQVGAVAKSIATIGDEAKRAGVGVKAFQEWKFVAEQNRIAVDSLVDGLKELNLRADEFVVTGKGPAAEAFQRLGYTAAELKEKLKDPSALLLEIIGRLQKLDQAAQIRIADEIFGGTAGERFVELISQGEAGIRKTIQTANDLGLVMDQELIEKAAELDRQFNLVSQTVGTALKTAIVEAAGALQNFIQQFRQFDADYAARRRAMELGEMAGSMAGTTGPRTTPKTGRLPQVDVPFSQLPPMDMTRQIALYAARDSISRLESGGNYRALGPITESGDRAYGRYQVMGANIAEWTKKAIGTVLTPEQFLNNPAFQDRVFDHIFGGYIDQFGAQGAAQAWFGGPGAVGKTQRTDQLGTSVGDYGKKFLAGMTNQWEGLREVSASYTAELERQQEQYQQMGQIANTVFNGLVNALSDGKIEGRELLQILMNVVQQLMSMMGFGGLGGGGGLLGMLFGGGGGMGGLGVGLYHKGGIVGRDPSGMRNVHPALFAGAPRYHRGGIAGLMPGEVPAILQRGEAIIPRGGIGGREGSTHISNHIQIRVEDGKAQMDGGQRTELARHIITTVQQQLVLEGRPGGILYNQARGR